MKMLLMTREKGVKSVSAMVGLGRVAEQTMALRATLGRQLRVIREEAVPVMTKSE